MRRGDKWTYLVVAVIAFVAMLAPYSLSAQTSSVNAYSPYSMYGPGELLTPGNVQMRSMGGIGIGLRSVGQVNAQNPAAASMIPRKSFLFDVGFDGTHYRNSQAKFNADGSFNKTAKTVYNTANIHNIAIALPLAKSVGLNLVVAPYSSVGYKIKNIDQQEDNWADIGRVMYMHSGDGDITEVKLSVGWAITRHISIGVAAKYFWGYLERNYSTEFTNVVTGSGSYASAVGVDRYVVNNFKMQAGAQISFISNEHRLLTLGLTYDLGGKLNPKEQNYVYANSMVNTINPYPIRDRIEALELRVPHEFGAGLYYADRMITWGLDYKYSTWGSANENYSESMANREDVVAYSDTHTIKAGFEITPRRTDVRNYLNRMSYRIGARVGNYYQTFAGERVNQLAVTAGVGFPVKIWGTSSFNLGFEYGRYSSPAAVKISGAKVGLVTQNYYKIFIGFSLFSADTSDHWFVRQKYN